MSKATIERPDHFLLALDDSEASDKAVRYLAALAETLPGDEVAITLFHVLRMPPRLVEHGGAEKPAEETLREGALAAGRQSWFETTKSEAKPLFDRARGILRQADVRDDRIRERVTSEVHNELARETLQTARDAGCGTVVVGRSSFPWYRELAKRHVADELIERAEDIAVCVVQ